MSAAQSVVFTPQIAELLDPHIQYFLLFLDRPCSGPPEAPWVTVYAFKAVLVAWQLGRAGVFSSIACLGLSDLKGMADWMRSVFSKRGRGGVGTLIMRSLDELERS